MKHKLSAFFLATIISAVSILPAFAAREGFTEVTQPGSKGESLGGILKQILQKITT